MSEPSSNMKAVLVIAQNKNIGPIITPAINIERDSINWEVLNYGGQSGGVQAALSWAYCLFCDEVPPKDWNYRDPFEGFFSMDREIQILILQAMAARHGFINLTVEDQPKSDLEKRIEDFGKQMANEEKRKGFKVVKSDEEN